MEALSVDIETRVLNDLDEVHELTQMGIEHPELIRVINNVESHLSSDVAFAYHILFTFAHVFHMRQRKKYRVTMNGQVGPMDEKCV
jgi:hypothetical protein